MGADEEGGFKAGPGGYDVDDKMKEHGPQNCSASCALKDKPHVEQLATGLTAY